MKTERLSACCVVSAGTAAAFPPAFALIIPYRQTAAIGPTDAMPVSPNESSEVEALALPDFERTAATPTPSAIMNGTVIGPVVAPPESNATPWNVFGDKNARMNTATYAMMRIVLSGMESTVRRIPSVTNNPIPAAMKRISPHLLMPGAIAFTWSAST